MNYKSYAYDLRKNVVDMIMAGGGGHIGGDMSVMDILVTLYFRVMNLSVQNAEDPNRDYLIMSKGHCVEALYSVLAAKGFFSIDEVIDRYARFGSEFIGHPNNKLPGVEMNSGSLGHGLPVGVGMALAAKMDHRPSRVYVVMGDGELAEGSVWEGATAAAMYGLDNLCAVIDQNGLQISGPTKEVMDPRNLEEKFAAFGWYVIPVSNGNDSDQLYDAFEEAQTVTDMPVLVLADTVKGYGSAVMENKASWHHRVPTKEEYEQIIRDLAAGKEAALHE